MEGLCGKVIDKGFDAVEKKMSNVMDAPELEKDDAPELEKDAVPKQKEDTLEQVAVKTVGASKSVVRVKTIDEACDTAQQPPQKSGIVEECLYRGRVAVIGCPGHGKSVVLNALAAIGKDDDELIFAEGCSVVSVTVPDPVTRTPMFELDVIYTDGWGCPDTDQFKAAANYDAVITQVVNHPEGLNALIWVVRPEQHDEALAHKCKTFIKEFSQAACPIIVLINGTQMYEAKLAKNLEKLRQRREDDARDLMNFAKKLLSNCGIFATDVIVSPDKSFLEENIVEKLLSCLQERCQQKHVSHVRTWESIQDSHDDTLSQFTWAKGAEKERLRKENHILFQTREDLGRYLYREDRDMIY